MNDFLRLKRKEIWAKILSLEKVLKDDNWYLRQGALKNHTIINFVYSTRIFLIAKSKYFKVKLK